MRKCHPKKKVKFLFQKKQNKKKAFQTTAISGNHLILQWVLQNRKRKSKRKKKGSCHLSYHPSANRPLGNGGRGEWRDGEKGEFRCSDSCSAIPPTANLLDLEYFKVFEYGFVIFFNDYKPQTPNLSQALPNPPELQNKVPPEGLGKKSCFREGGRALEY